MLDVNNSIAKIDGSKGIYDGKISNPSVKYGRNAVDNLYSYLEKPLVNNDFNPAPILDFGLNQDATEKNVEKLEKFLKKNDEYLDALPPLEYEYRYMPVLPKGEIDKKALLSAAYEEMGRVKELSVEELDYRFAPNDKFSSSALDLNKDGKINMAEYSTSILAADMLSKSDKPDFKNVDGTIDAKGFNAVFAYNQKSNTNAATKLYSQIYENFNLNEPLNDEELS